jgi:hypothetical protein
MSEPKQVIEIRDEEIAPMLNAAIAGKVLGYERRALGYAQRPAESNQWYGRRDLKAADATPEWLSVDELPNFAGETALAMDLFVKIATDHGFIPALRIDNQAFDGAELHPVHVGIMQRVNNRSARRAAKAGKKGSALAPITRVSGPTISRTVCLAVVELYGVDMKLLHRELFPHRYLTVVSNT